MTADPRRSARRPVWREAVAPLLALAVMVALARVIGPRWGDWQDALARSGPAAPLAYLGLWLALVPWGFPAAALGLSAGFLFGVWPGVAWAVLGLVLSGLLMFPLGRRWLRPRVGRLAAASPRLARLERAASRGGVRLHILARLSPLNYAMACYTLAAGGAGLRAYLPGLAGAVPGLVAYVWVGSLAQEGARGEGTVGPVRVVLSVVGGLSLLALIVVVARQARRSLPGETDDDPSA